MSGKYSEIANRHFKINEEYKSLTNFVSAFISKANTKTFNSINIFVNNKLLELKDNNLLKNKDEEIYLYCNYLNDSFKKFINLYNKNKRFIISDKKIEILDGLKLILSNQINQYFEIYNEKEINPILEEKLKIIRASMGIFERKQIRSLDNNTIVLNKDITKDVIFNFSKQPDQDALFVTAIVENFTDFIENNVCTNYLLTKADCLANINDLERRKITTKYLELMKQEYEILSSIIKVQVIPLEKISSETNEEKISIDKMLSVIREAYQFISRKFDELSIFLIEAEKNSRLTEEENKEAFDNECIKSIYDSMNNLEMKFFFNIVKEKYNSIVKKIEDNILYKIKLETQDYSDNILRESREKTKAYLRMTRDLISALNIYVNFNKAYATKTDELPANDILKGISETLEIKVESINEKCDEFIVQINDSIEKLLKNDSSFSDKEKEYLNNLLMNINEFKSEKFSSTEIESEDISNGFTLAALNDSEFESYIDKRVKALESKKDKIDKIFTLYLRDNILSEIMTFEEIEHYSLSKLKEDEDEVVKKYVSIFEKTMNYLDNLLIKNNIERICPNTHDIFNPKEHEILVAEKKDGFSKGEIIKPLNEGFKKDGLVIIRANIVAAK